jgi:hypothetical protein
MNHTARAPKRPLQIPNIVKYQPLPSAFNRGCKTATPAAAMAHLVMLAAAAAVLGLSGNTSTRRVLYIV